MSLRNVRNHTPHHRRHNLMKCDLNIHPSHTVVSMFVINTFTNIGTTNRRPYWMQNAHLLPKSYEILQQNNKPTPKSIKSWKFKAVKCYLNKIHIMWEHNITVIKRLHNRLTAGHKQWISANAKRRSTDLRGIYAEARLFGNTAMSLRYTAQHP